MLSSTLLPLLSMLSPLLPCFSQQQQRFKQNSRKILIRFCISVFVCFFVVAAVAVAVTTVHLKHLWYESFVFYLNVNVMYTHRHRLVSKDFLRMRNVRRASFALISFFLLPWLGKEWMFYLLYYCRIVYTLHCLFTVAHIPLWNFFYLLVTWLIWDTFWMIRKNISNCLLNEFNRF